jgi:hypothetical protein
VTKIPNYQNIKVQIHQGTKATKATKLPRLPSYQVTTKPAGLLACWLLVGWLVHSFWHHFASFWDHFDIILGPVGIILGPLGTIVGHLGKKLLYGEPMYRI